jgi:hypothetical protein
MPGSGRRRCANRGEDGHRAPGKSRRRDAGGAGRPEETTGGQEEDCPEEEMSRFIPYENGDAFERLGM